MYNRKIFLNSKIPLGMHISGCNNSILLPVSAKILRSSKYTFPISFVHAQIGLREKLIDKIAHELVGEVRFKQLQDEWIIPISGPPKK